MYKVICVLAAFATFSTISTHLILQSKIAGIQQKLDQLSDERKQQQVVTQHQSGANVADVKHDKPGTTKITIPDGYDVLDVGSSKGKGSITFLKTAVSKLRFIDSNTAELLDARTLGLDNDPNKVRLCNEANRDSRNDCLLFNILTDTPQDLQIGTRTISGNTYWHVLEHIPDCVTAEEMWAKTAAFSKRFSSFRGPAFDDELVTVGETPTGPHRFWENWSGHKCHFNATMMERAIGTVRKTQSFVVINFGKFETTRNDIFVPADTPLDSHHYNPKTMSTKEIIELETPVYEEMRACAVYEDLEHLSLYSALCLQDAFQGPARLRNLPHLVTACQIAEEEDLTKDDCAQRLKLQALETIRHFEQLHTPDVLRTI